jgi:hypothetical protein
MSLEMRPLPIAPLVCVRAGGGKTIAIGSLHTEVRAHRT